MRTYRNQRGFTLVEILIVVIILGILAAVVIPQFTSASEDARRSSTISQLQTLRSQIELYKLQHRDQVPALQTNWNQFTMFTNEDGTTSGTKSNEFRFGPYMQAEPKNPLNGRVNVTAVTEDVAAGATVAECGWVYNTVNGRLWATDRTGTRVIDDRGEVPAPSN